MPQDISQLIAPGRRCADASTLNLGAVAHAVRADIINAIVLYGATHLELNTPRHEIKAMRRYRTAISPSYQVWFCPIAVLPGRSLACYCSARSGLMPGSHTDTPLTALGQSCSHYVVL
jgi:hypothetical protein